MPFAGIVIPSIQLPILEGYLKERNICTKTQHLYLKAAEFYGLPNYEYLIYPPNEPFTAQMVFSKHVYLNHWKTTEDRYREYFNKNLSKNDAIQQDFSFEKYVERTDQFYKWVLEHVDWRLYDIIGFTLNYGQLLPSLAIAKKIKELAPEKIIVFGGSRTVAPLGMKVLEACDYLDFIVSGEGEESLYRLTAEYPDYKSIPRLIYRKEGKIIWNNSDYFIDLNSSPIPSYDPFFEELKTTSKEIQQVFYQKGRIPVEISRGCWWNQCSFCNQKIIHPIYREKNVDRFIEEIQWLADRYKIADFQIIGSTLPKDHRSFLKKIIELNRGFTFICEARAGQLKSSDYTLLKNANFSIIQTGIESFSSNYLKKMKKGTRVIDNIATLKFCKENGITNWYNIIVNYPNEEHVDFEETKKNIQLIKQYLDLPNICQLRVVYGNEIYNNPEHYNIEKLVPSEIDTIVYPPESLDKGLAYVYDFQTKQKKEKYDWNGLIEEWKKEQKLPTSEEKQNQPEISMFRFYFTDNINFLKIYDKRDLNDVKIYNLNKLERDIFLACTDVISFPELKEKLSHIPDFKLAAILDTFEQHKILYREDEYYLSLPLNYRILTHKELQEEHTSLCYSSEIQQIL
jgi:ribosomal peptide maturation radical SAM protein 1